MSAEGASQSRTGTCTDNAGNSASNTVGGISIDKTAPSVSGSRSPTANAQGWNNSPVTVSFACTDALSGVLRTPADAVLSAEGAGQSASGVCVDNADNTGQAGVQGVNIDLTAPEVRIALDGTAGKNGWWVSLVTASLPCTDALSGVPAGGITYALDGAPGNDSGPVNITGDGQHQLDAACKDRADNTARETASVPIDTTAPDGDVDTPTLAIGAYDAAWTAFDATSGVARVIVEEYFFLGAFGSKWADVCEGSPLGVVCQTLGWPLRDDGYLWTAVCDEAVASIAGANVTGSCTRDPGPALYCYRVVVEDQAGNVFTSHPTNGDSVLALDLVALDRCTVKATPPGLPGLPVAAGPSREVWTRP